MPALRLASSREGNFSVAKVFIYSGNPCATWRVQFDGFFWGELGV